MKARNAIESGLTCVALVVVARFAHYALALLCYPYPWEIREALSLHHGLLLARGESLYQLSAVPPQVIPAYGPLYPALIAPFLQTEHPSFFIPRLISLLSVGAILSAVGVLSATLCRSWRWGAIAVAVALLRMDWWRWLLLGRPDGLALFLAFSALLVHARWPRHWLALSWCATLLVLAFFAKTTTVMAAASIAASLAVLHRDPKRAVAFAFGVSFAVGSAVVLANALTGGLYWVFSFRILSSWIQSSGSYMAIHALWLGFCYLPVWLILILPRSGSSRTLVPGLKGVLTMHLLVGTPMTALLLLNTGGYAYYWYAILPAAAVLFCTLLGAREAHDRTRLEMASLVLMGVWLVRAAVWSNPVPSLDAFGGAWKALASVVDSSNGPVMNDDATAILNLWSHKGLYSDGVGYAGNAAWLARTLGVSVQDPEARLRSHYYALLLNPENLAVAERYYAKVGSYVIPVQLGDPRTIEVFVPRQQEPEQSVGRDIALDPAKRRARSDVVSCEGDAVHSQ